MSPKCRLTFLFQSKKNMPMGNLRYLFSYTVLLSVNYSFLVLKKAEESVRLLIKSFFGIFCALVSITRLPI